MSGTNANDKVEKEPQCPEPTELDQTKNQSTTYQSILAKPKKCGAVLIWLETRFTILLSLSVEEDFCRDNIVDRL